MVKTSKRHLRKIDGTADLQQLEHELEMKAAKAADNLFVEDTVGGFKGVPKAIRQQVSVIDSAGRVAISKGEHALVKRLVESKTTLKTPKASGKITKKETPVFDAWATGPVSRRKARARNVPFVPAVVLPHNGQSINPDPTEYVSLIESIAMKELSQPKPEPVQPVVPVESIAPVEPEPQEDEDLYVAIKKKIPVRKTTADKNRLNRHKQLLLTHSRERTEKLIEKQINHLPALVKKVNQAEAALEESLKRKEVMAAEELVSIASGNVRMRGAGGKFYESPTAISLPGSSLRRAVPSVNPISERMNSILRQRLVEQRPLIDGEYLNKMKAQKHHKKRFGSKFASRDSRDISLLR